MKVLPALPVTTSIRSLLIFECVAISITFHHHLERLSDTAQPKSSFCKLLGIDSECAPAMDFAYSS